MKVCTKCKENKNTSEFAKHNKRKDGLNSWCKQCNKTYTKQWYSTNENTHKLTVKNRKQSYKNLVQNYIIEYFKTHFCIDCNESNPLVLDFDHRDRSKKMRDIGNIASTVTKFDLSILKEEIEKCDVRCANCHRIKTAKENNNTRYRILQNSIKDV